MTDTHVLVLQFIAKIENTVNTYGWEEKRIMNFLKNARICKRDIKQLSVFSIIAD